MGELLEKVRKLRSELDEQQSEIQSSLGEKMARLSLLCARGIVPEHEACAAFESRVDAMATEGESQIRQAVGGFLRPRHEARNASPSTFGRGTVPSIISMLGFRNQSSPGLAVGNAPDVLAFLLRDQLIAAGRAMIREAVVEADRDDRLVPDEETRQDEIESLDDEIDRLRADAEAIQSELASIGRVQGDTRRAGQMVYSPDDDDPGQ